MLSELHIKDVVIIKTLSLNLAAGFSAFTGETGAGKSIILDALGLALGQRSEARLVRKGCDQASVTAVFDLAHDGLVTALHEIFTASDVAFSMPLMLRRVLLRDGKSRAYVNDQPVSIGFLKQLGERLVEIHGQFETQKLLDPKTHRFLLDGFAGLHPQAAQLRHAWQEWQEARRALHALETMLEQAERDREYWQESLGELRDLAPLPDEEDRLVEQRSLMMHAEKLLENMDEANKALTLNNTGAQQRLHAAMRSLERVQDKIPERLVPVLEGLNRALIEVDEAVETLEILGHDLSFDQQAQAQTDERLFALRGAARKYNVAVANLPDYLHELEQKLAVIDDQSAQMKKMQARVAEKRAAYCVLAERLGTRRREAGEKLAQAVMDELGPLRLEKALFRTAVEPRDEAQWNADGMENVTFLISTNPGTDPGPLNKIASGGEMARFMLALKVVTQESGTTPTLIFDEVDTGVGGAVAEAIGLRLRRLGDTAQLFAVTHSPQVAAKAHSHLLISKTTQDHETSTRVAMLDEAERTEEIARMLSGSVITGEARAAARNLLDQNHIAAPVSSGTNAPAGKTAPTRRKARQTA